MYYGLDGFGMDDLASSEMGQFGAMGVDAPAPSSPSFFNASTDIPAIGQVGQNFANVFAQYEMAKANVPLEQQKLALQQQMALTQMQLNAQTGMSNTTKTVIAVGVGLAAIGALVFIMRKRGKARNGKRSSFGSGWRTVG